LDRRTSEVRNQVNDLLIALGRSRGSDDTLRTSAITLPLRAFSAGLWSTPVLPSQGKVIANVPQC